MVKAKSVYTVKKKASRTPGSAAAATGALALPLALAALLVAGLRADIEGSLNAGAAGASTLERGRSD